MATVKITQAELDEIIQVAQRIARRFRAVPIVLRDRVEIETTYALLSRHHDPIKAQT